MVLPNFDRDLNLISMYAYEGTKRVDTFSVGQAIGNVASISLDKLSDEQRNKLHTVLRKLADQKSEEGKLERKDVSVIPPIEDSESNIRGEAARIAYTIEEFVPFVRKEGGIKKLKEPEEGLSKKHIKLQNDLVEWKKDLLSDLPNKELEKRFDIINETFVALYQEMSTQAQRFKDKHLAEITQELEACTKDYAVYFEKNLRSAKSLVEEEGQIFLHTNYDYPKKFHENYRSYRKTLTDFNMLQKSLLKVTKIIEKSKTSSSTSRDDLVKTFDENKAILEKILKQRGIKSLKTKGCIYKSPMTEQCQIHYERVLAKHNPKKEGLSFLFSSSGKEDTSTQTLKGTDDPKMLAHVLGGFMIENMKELEGSTIFETMNYMVEGIEHALQDPLIKESMQKNLLKFRSELIQSLMYAKRIDDLEKQTIQGSFDTNAHQLIVHQTLAQLQALKEGESILLAGGWTSPIGGSGHAMLYRFEKNKRGTIDLSIINTGAGSERHDRVIQGTKQKFNPVRYFPNLNFVPGEIDERLLTSFLEKQLLPLKKHAIEFNADNIYGVEVKRLEHKEVRIALTPQDWITGQRSGVCAYKSVLIASRLCLGVKDYKIFKHLLELKTLNDGTNKLLRDVYNKKTQHHVIHILERASLRTMSSTLKLRRKNLISAEDGRSAYDKAQFALVAVDNFRQLPFEPYRSELKQIYHTATLCTSLAAYRASIQLPSPKIQKSKFIHLESPILEIMQGSAEECLDHLQKSIVNLPTDQSPYRTALISNLLKQIDYTTHSDIWDQIASNDDLRKKAINFIDLLSNEIAIISAENRSILNVAYYINILTLASLLATYQWNNGPLDAFGISSNTFDSFYNNWSDLEIFGSSYGKNSETIKKFSINKIDLFPMLELENHSQGFVKEIDFSDKTDFEKIPILKFLEAFLKKHPEIENELPLSGGHLSALKDNLPGLGLGEEQRIRRIRAIQVFTEINGREPLCVRISSDYEAFTMLNHLSSIWRSAINNGQYSRFPSYQWFPLKLSLQYRSESLQKIQQSLIATFPRIQLTKGLTGLNHPNLFNKRNKHEPQNGVITAYNNVSIKSSLVEEERELLVAISEKEIQISRLIDLFERNPAWIKNPTYQRFLKCHLLEKKLLVEQISAEPLLGQRLVNFLKVAFPIIPQKNKAAIVEEINKQLFLTQLTQKIIQHLQQEKRPSSLAHDRFDIGFILQVENELKEIRSYQMKTLYYQEAKTEETWLKSFIDYTILHSHPLLEKESLNLAESHVLIKTAANAQLNLTKAQKNWETEPYCRDYYDFQVEQEALRNMVNKGSAIQKSLGKDFPEACQTLLTQYGYPNIETSLWKGEFPEYTAMNDTETYKVNLLMGTVIINDKTDAFPEKFRSASIYKQLFEKKEPDEWIPFGMNGFQTHYQGKLIQLIPDKNDLPQFIIHEKGIPYLLQDRYKIDIIRFPASLKRETLIWVAPLSSLDPALLIFDLTMENKIAEGMNDGTIRMSSEFIFKEEGEQKGEQIQPLSFIEIAQTNLKSIASFRRTHSEVWEKEGQITSINYRDISDENGKTLAFTANQEGKLCWQKDPNFFIAENQSLNLLRGYEDYLLLQNSLGEQLLVLPRMTYKNKLCYSAIPLSKTGEFEPLNALQNLHAAEILFANGNYARSIHYLLQAQEPRPYSIEERTIAKRLLKTKVGDPFACLVRIYAANHVIDNINLTPPSMRNLKNEEALFWKRDVYDTIVNDYSKVVSNRNVPERYQPSKILGRDRQLRLLQKLKAYQGSRNLKFTNALTEYFWKTSVDHYTPNMGRNTIGDPVVPRKADYAIPSFIFKRILERASSKEFTLSSIQPLNLPGDDFERHFIDYYGQATSDNPIERNDLKDRLTFMRFDQHSVNNQLATMLLEIIDVKNSPNGKPKIPNLPAWKDSDEKLELFLKWKSPITSERVGNDNEYPHYDLPSVITPTNERKIRPPFKRIKARPPFLSKNISPYVAMIPTKNSSASLQKETEHFIQQSTLPKYVVDKLTSLEQLVRTGVSENGPIYTLKNDVSSKDLEDGFNREIENNSPKIKDLKVRILQLANKRSGDSERDLELDLLQGSGKQEPWTIEKCLASFLRDDWELYTSQQPVLSALEIDELHSLIVEFLITNIHSQRAERGLNLLQELEDVRGNTTAEINLKEELGALLVASNTYDINH
ncbi:MAG: hypothetical protein H0X29_06985, partial [Parachlamydiaceae bacterium]|nr:hypothetical protein [Parachlamydiaceae bacterium]